MCFFFFLFLESDAASLPPPPRLVQTYFSPLMLRLLLSARLFPRALVARVRAPPRGSALVASGLLVFAANGDVAHAAGSEPAAKKRKGKVGTTERKKVRGGALLLPRGHQKRRTNPRRPVFTLRPFPCERAPPQG